MKEQTKIGVCGISGGVGVSFIASNLARHLALTASCRPTVVETRNDSLYNGLGMESHFSKRPFFDHLRAITDGNRVRGQENECFGINWVVPRNTSKPLLLSLTERIKLLHNCSGNPVLLDFSGWSNDEVLATLEELDAIVVVVDALPSKLLAGQDRLSALRTVELPVLYLINKENRGIDKRELNRFLQVKDSVEVPMLPIEIIYSAEYRCRLCYDMPSAKRELENAFEMVIKKLEKLGIAL